MTAIALIIASRWYGRSISVELLLPATLLATLCILSIVAMIDDPMTFADLYTMM